MPLAERRERHAASLAKLRENGSTVWIENFLRSLRLAHAGNGLNSEDREAMEWTHSKREADAAYRR